MTKRMLLALVVALAVLGLFAETVALAKAHVPLGRAQICTPTGKVKTVSGRRLSNELARDACRLTACVFNDVDDGDLVQQFIFFPGEDCDPVDDDGDGFCDAVGNPKSIPKRLKANDITPACTDSF